MCSFSFPGSPTPIQVKCESSCSSFTFADVFVIIYMNICMYIFFLYIICIHVVFHNRAAGDNLWLNASAYILVITESPILWHEKNPWQVLVNHIIPNDSKNLTHQSRQILIADKKRQGLQFFVEKRLMCSEDCLQNKVCADADLLDDVFKCSD